MTVDPHPDSNQHQNLTTNRGSALAHALHVWSTNRGSALAHALHVWSTSFVFLSYLLTDRKSDRMSDTNRPDCITSTLVHHKLQQLPVYSHLLGATTQY